MDCSYYPIAWLEEIMLLFKSHIFVGESPGCQFFSWDFSEFSTLAEVCIAHLIVYKYLSNIEGTNFILLLPMVPMCQSTNANV